MKCSLCERTLGGQVATITVGSDFGATTANWCYPCVEVALGRPARQRLFAEVLRSGWFQPPLPLFGPRAVDIPRN